MMATVPTQIEVHVDTAEKKPLPFPETILWHPSPGATPVRLQINPVPRKLYAGDYRLAIAPGACIIERKGSVRELAQNFFTKDRRRQLKAFDKLIASCDYPYLVIEGRPLDLWSGLGLLPENEESGKLLDHLLAVAARKRLQIIWGGNTGLVRSRRLLGEVVVRILLRHAHDQKDQDQ